MQVDLGRSRVEYFFEFDLETLTRPKQAPLHRRLSKPEKTSDILLRVVFEMIEQQDSAIFQRQSIQPLPKNIVALVDLRLWGLCGAPR